MIEFDYKLTVDMKTSAPEYRPDPKIPKRLRNIFKMSGPNSSGKSTFMNIVALATHGLKNPSISDSIKVRMKDLIEADYKTLEFDLKIEDPVSKTVLRAKKTKDSRDITLYESEDGEKEKILSSDSFLKKYKLVYDIPENPIGRIKELASEIIDWQKGYSDHFHDLQRYVDDVHKAAKSSRDERAIGEKKRDLESAVKDLDAYRSTDKTSEIELLTKLIHAKELFQAKIDTDNAEAALEPMKKYLKPVSGGRADSVASNNISNKFLTVKTIVDDIITYSAAIKDSKLNEIVDDIQTVKFASQISKKEDLSTYISRLNDFVTYALKIEVPKVDNEARAINDLLEILYKYKGDIDFISGIGYLNKVIESLEATASGKNDNSAKRRAVEKIKECAKKMSAPRDELLREVLRMDVPQRDESDTNYKAASKFESAYKDAKSRRDRLLEGGRNYGLDLNNAAWMVQHFNKELQGKYSSYKVDKLKEELRNLEGSSVNIKEIKKLDTYINDTRATIKMMEAAENHEYKGKESIILRISNELQGLRGNYKTAQMKIDGMLKKQDIRDPNDPFFESLWVYFGSRLGYVQHLEKSYEVEKFNFIKDLIICKDGTHIHTNDMGTGQSQLSYLLGLIPSDGDKKVIAMFDEVAAMSSITLNGVFDRFKELQDRGKLMLGMTVYPEDDFEVTQYGSEG